MVPILRAGLGMLDGMTRLLPTAEVGFLGMIRDESTLKAETYATRLPEDLSGRQVYVLDPMLATGGTLAAAIQFLFERGADDVTAHLPAGRPGGNRPSGQGLRRTRQADPPGDRGPGRAAERERLHRPRARRRRRPPLRRRLKHPLSSRFPQKDERSAISGYILCLPGYEELRQHLFCVPDP